MRLTLLLATTLILPGLWGALVAWGVGRISARIGSSRTKVWDDLPHDPPFDYQI